MAAKWLNIGAHSLLFLTLVLEPGAAQSGPAGSFTATAKLPADAASLLVRARGALETGDLNTAEEDARRAIQLQPDFAPAVYFLARLLQRRDSPRDSLAWFNRATKAAPPTGDDLRIVALDYVLLSDTREALHWLTRSVAMDPANAEAWYDLGRVKMTQGDFAAALPPMQRALALEPHMVKAENNLGVICEAQNRPADAAQAYSHAVSWQSGQSHPSEQPLLNYGALLNTQQKAAEAAPLLEQAVAIAPTCVKCHEELARAFGQTDNLARAITEMTRASTLDPNNPRLHFQLGQLYRRAGDSASAAQQFALSGKLYQHHSSETEP